MILFSLLATALTDPSINIYLTAAAITFLAIFSATQDIVIDAYRIESAPQNYQGPLSSMYIAGYRLAMLVGGAGSLWLASYLGVETYKQSVWMIVYISMGALMFIGILTTLLSSEPANPLDILSAVITVIKKLILASDIANQANNRLLDAAINAPKKRAFIVPNLRAKKPPRKPPIIVANTPKNFE